MEDSPDVEDGSKGPCFKWTDDMANAMLELCIAYQRRNGKKQLFKWEDLATEFGELVGRKCTKVILKNKFESMKREYKAWKFLRAGVTGLGWDPIMRRISANDAWWDKKIKANKRCKKFRNRGMEAKLEELWERLYEDNVATGQLALSPSMSPCDDDESTDPQGNETPTGIDQNIAGREDIPYPSVDGANPQKQLCVHQPTRPSSSNTRASKRAKRKSIGSSKFEDHLAQQRANNGNTVAIFEEEATSTGKSRTELQEGLLVIDNMVKAGMLEETSPLWCYAVSLNKRKNHRATILNLSSNANRLAYLKWEFARDAA